MILMQNISSLEFKHIAERQAVLVYAAELEKIDPVKYKELAEDLRKHVSDYSG